MNVKQFLGHPIVSNLLVTFIATILAYKTIKYWEAKSAAKNETSKMSRQPIKLSPTTSATIAEPVAKEVTQTVQ